MSSQLHLADTTRFRIRPATHEDLTAITEVWFESFAVDPFWQYLFPDSPRCRREYLDKMWAIGLDNPTDRTFVAVDSEKDGKVVAWSRWMVPQADGKLERKWPDDLVDLFDMELMETFFTNMENNRKEIMGKRPHWLLELLGVHQDYQGKGIGASLIKWGTDQADADGLETYLDGSAKGQPYYEKVHGFKPIKAIEIPDRPAYGSYSDVSMLRQPAVSFSGSRG